MGWFKKKKDVAAPITTDYVGSTLEEGNLPVAVAVQAESPPAYNPAASQPAVIQPAAAQRTIIPVHPLKQQPPYAQPLKTRGAIPLPRCPTVVAFCPHCNKQNGMTRCRTSPHWLTWIVALALVFLFWPLCWVPFVTDCMKKTKHYCQNCNMMVGSVSPFQDCCVKHRS